MNEPRIETCAEAVAFLNRRRMEVICTLGGFIVREEGFGNAGFQITCDSIEDLIDFARNERDIIIGMAGGRSRGGQPSGCSGIQVPEGIPVMPNGEICRDGATPSKMKQEVKQ